MIKKTEGEPLGRDLLLEAGRLTGNLERCLTEFQFSLKQYREFFEKHFSAGDVSR